VQFVWRNRPPRRFDLRVRGIAIPEKQLEFVHGALGNALLIVAGPPAEFPRGQPLLAEPKSLAVVREESHGGSATVPEAEHGTSQGVGAKDFAAEVSQAIDSVAEVDRSDGKENPHVRGELDHA
jgi:hypothetical protein